MLIGLFHHLERGYLYKNVTVRAFVCSRLIKRSLCINMSEQQATAGAEAPKKSAAQLKKEAKKKEKLEKYEAKMKAMEASKAAAGDVSDALLLENYH